MDNSFDVVLGRSVTSGGSVSSSAGASHMQNGHSHHNHHTSSTTNSQNGSGSNHNASNSSTSSSSSLGANNTPKTKLLVVTPEQVVKLYGYKLTNYETQEIYGYSNIYFIGANAKKRSGECLCNLDFKDSS